MGGAHHYRRGRKRAKREDSRRSDRLHRGLGHIALGFEPREPLGQLSIALANISPIGGTALHRWGQRRLDRLAGIGPMAANRPQRRPTLRRCSKMPHHDDPYAVHAVVETLGVSPVAGRVVWGPAHSLWNGGMMLATLILGPRPASTCPPSQPSSSHRRLPSARSLCRLPPPAHPRQLPMSKMA